MFKVFNSPGKSGSHAKDVRDDEYVDVEDMSHHVSQRKRRGQEERTTQ